MNTAFRARLLGCLLAFAQAIQAADEIVPRPDRPGARPPELPEYLPEAPRPGFDLPSVRPGERPLLPEGGPAFVLKDVVFEGNTVFSDAELEAIAQPFLGRRITLADLEELRYRLTRKYTDSDYINSGFVLKPGQEVDDGVVIYQAREGRLDEVRISGTDGLKPDYVRDRIWTEPEQPFNTEALQERFQLLLRDPLIERMDGKLRSGVDPGRAILNLDITRARLYELYAGFDNHRAPSTGAEWGYVGGVFYNLTGYGDALDFSIGSSEGATEGAVGFAFPINRYDTRLTMRLDATDASVIEEPLEDLDIESESRSVELGLIHPFIDSLQRTVLLGATLVKRKNETSLLDEPFSFSSGAEEGKSRVTIVRLIQELQDRTQVRALALRSTFSIGTDAFDATVHDGDRPDGKFLAWLGQAQYAQRLGDRGAQLILRGDIQLSDDELLDLERFAVGGARTVRGYRENELVRDNGYAVSAELRYPVWKSEAEGPAQSSVQIATFTDFGAAWNEGASTNRDRLHSVGLGLLWNYSSYLNAECYLAHDLKEAKPKPDYDLQDDGIHFRVNLRY